MKTEVMLFRWSIDALVRRRSCGSNRLAPTVTSRSFFRSSFGLQIAALLIFAGVPSVALGASSANSAAFTFTNLFSLSAPSGYSVRSVTGISTNGSQVVGIDGQGGSGFTSAIVWNSPTSLGSNLNPTSSNSSAALATNGQLQVGAANAPGANEEHPIVWSGTANSGVYLSPGNYLGVANGVVGNQIVGVSDAVATVNHAMLWNASNDAPTDLQPTSTSYYGSDAIATDGIRQVGYAQTTNNGSSVTHAMLWNSTATSAADLNPPTTTFSQALGIQGTQQVGIGLFGSNYHAMLWTGSAGSAVDLDPANYAFSEAVATNGIDQIGYADQGSQTAYHAMAWDGTAASAVDLSSLIPGATSSQALSIDANGDIFGYANEPSGLYAVEWTPVPEPTTTSFLTILGTGLLNRQSNRRRRKPLDKSRFLST